MAKNIGQEEMTRKILNRIRTIQENEEKKEKSLLREEKEGDEKSIAITDDPRFGQNVLSNQISQFRSSVESGAEFSKPDPENVAVSPLIYTPKDKNLVFSGVIPCLNNMKWQFVLKTSTGTGCFIWSDGLILNNENIKILNKLFGYYQNWRESWNAESGDLEKMANLFNENN